MNTNYKITIEPTEEPVTIVEAKDQCRVETEFVDDDTFLTNAIVAARQHFEKAADLFLVDQTVELALARFPTLRKIELSGSEVSAITTLKYFDADDSTQTLAASKYDLIDYAHPHFIELASVESWPSTFDRSDAVVITYQAGYATAAAVPRSIKSAILMMVQELYLNRETTTEDGKQSILNRAYRSLLSMNKTYARW